MDGESKQPSVNKTKTNPAVIFDKCSLLAVDFVGNVPKSSFPTNCILASTNKAF